MEVGSKGMAAHPAIQNYSDYRKFLEDFYLYKKSLRSGFSYRLFAKLAGIKSPNYLQLVMRKERNLSEEMAVAVAEAMKLKENEKKYFVALVKQANSSSEEGRLQATKEGLTAIRKIVSRQIEKSKVEVFSTWYHLLVRELSFLEDFEPNGEYVSLRLNNLISAKQAQESLDLLIGGGFLVFKNGKWTAADPVIDSGDKIFAHANMVKIHSDILRAWSQHLKNCDPVTLEMGMINIPIAKEKIPELKRRMRDFQDQIIGWLQSEQEADAIVQMGTYLVPMVLRQDK